MILCSIAVIADALPKFSATFKEHYKVAKGSNLDKAGCMLCHTSPKGKALNAYGTDLKAQLKAAGSKKLSSDMLVKVEPMDSTKTGMTNGQKIKKDINPGIK
ncbi:MAG: hypothetical protein JSS72_06565 [Armatimonadetes bacterium]|nr:hypothetical protein [Armatimonadota bacterium]